MTRPIDIFLQIIIDANSGVKRASYDIGTIEPQDMRDKLRGNSHIDSLKIKEYRLEIEFANLFR